MKTFFIYLMVCNSFIVLAQTPNPMDFFPSAVGNVWEYSGQWGGREEIYMDSIDQYGYRFTFIKFNSYYAPYASFKIDTTLKQVFYTPLYLDWLYYKLDADTGCHWMVRPETTEVQRLEALVLAKYPFVCFGRPSIFMEIMYYELPRGDTVINENAWPRFKEILAEGIGEIMYIDQEGGGPYKILEGCIINGDTLGTITSVNENIISVNSFELFQNYPNPFNPSTKITYNIPQRSYVSLKIYDALGKEIATLVNDQKEAGTYRIQFDASKLSSGVYIYSIQAGVFLESRKMILMK